MLTLVRMRLTVWKRTPNDLRAVGVCVGAALAGATILIALGRWGGEESSGDLLAIALAAWLAGWVFGPVQSGGSDLVRPEWFTLLPLETRRLAYGLLLAGCVGIGAGLTVVACASLVVYGARHGTGPALVAVPAALLLPMLMVTISKLVGELLSGAARSRIATEVVAAQWGLLIAALIAGWSVFPPLLEIADRLGTEFSDLLPGSVAVLLRVLPSGWGVVGVEAAADGDWWLALAALAAVVAALWAGIGLWTRLLRSRTTGGRTGAVSRPRVTGRRLLPATPLGAVVAKDLRTWWRDPRRGIEVRSTLWAGLFTTVALWLLLPDVLAFAGVVVAVLGAMACVNVYAMDGTALWHTLLVPGAERVDVRGRQLAWLLIFVPASVVPSALGLAISGASWAVPWVLALVPALLGGAAGLIPLLSVIWLVAETDAHKRSGNPAETGADATGLYFAMLAATLLTAAPAGGLLALGEATGSPAITWLAVPVGAVTGLLFLWGLAAIAASRLDARGPELLQRMRVGPRAPEPETGDAESALPPVRSALVGVLWTVAMISLFPQGLLPLAFLALGVDEQAWFASLFLAGAWRYLVAVAFIALGLGALWGALRLQRLPG
jgi:ABC-2 type transport system permease protein